MYRWWRWVGRSVLVLGLLMRGCLPVWGADTTLKTIGILQMTSVLDSSVERFKKRLAELGYREGSTVTYVYKNAQGSPEALRTYAEELSALPVDVLFALTTAAATAAQRATVSRPVPIVFTAVFYPQEAGLIDRVERPGGWITGTSPLVLASKQLEILAQAVPQMYRLGVVYTEGDHPVVLERLTHAAQARHVQLHTAPVHQPGEVLEAVKGLLPLIDALYIPPDNVVTTQLAAIIQLALEYRVPTMVPGEAGVQQGALLSYSADYLELAALAAEKAQKILQGTAPANIPVEYPARPKLTINLRTSRALGLEMSASLLFLADEVIDER